MIGYCFRKSRLVVSGRTGIRAAIQAGVLQTSGCGRSIRNPRHGLQTCDDLLADYRCAVNLFKNFVHNSLGAPGEDSRLTGKRAADLAQKCPEASDALIEHWRKEHSSFREKARSRASGS